MSNSNFVSKAQREAHLARHIERLSRRVAELHRRSNRLAQVRLVVFLLGASVSGAVFWFQGAGLGSVVLLLGGLAFGVSVYAHRQIESSLIAHQLLHDIKSTHLARMRLNWAKIEPPKFVSPPKDHPFAQDLDLLGHRSLLHLLDTTVAQEASDRLQSWFLAASPSLSESLRRQALVQVLRPLTLFRDRLSLKARQATSGSIAQWRAKPLLDWLDSQAKPRPLKGWLAALGGLAVLNWALLIAVLLGNLASGWLTASVTLYVAVMMFRWPEVIGVFGSSLILRNNLQQVQAVFAYLEDSPHSRHPALRDLCAPFLNPAERPSALLKRLNWIAGAAGLSHNIFFGVVLNLAGPWNLAAAHQLNRYQSRLRETLPGWLDAWFELEALSALATFAYLHPHYAFPQLQAEADGPLLQAEGLGHPLILEANKVRNNFLAQSLGQVGLITGSNMAGKSTFLRTVGLNLQLAYAGTVVDAYALSGPPVRVFTCIKVSDSVADGFSYFYAEVRRLRALLDALAESAGPPLFFLVDEIFRGTNNRERLLGSQAFIRALVGQRGYGLLSTHDLALVQLAEETAAIKNYHFRDGVEAGQMVFDYQLRPGPCPTTNALRIMKLAGLPLPEGS